MSLLRLLYAFVQFGSLRGTGVDLGGVMRRYVSRMPWHNWVYAAYYLFLGLMGLWAFLWVPPLIYWNYGDVLPWFWEASAVGCGLVGLFGALRPNFRAEMLACGLGLMSIIAYGSSMFWVIGETIGIGAEAWGVSAHVWPLLLRLLFIYVETRRLARSGVIDVVKG